MPPSETADAPSPVLAAPHPEANAAPPGYVLERELGRGGMGVVYLARQDGLNRPVALKMILGAANERALIRFLAEAEAVAAVRHPNVVEVYHFGQHGARPYLALEFCPGGDLDALAGAGKLEPRRAAELMAQVAEGVAAAHAQGIVHRDLKPHNVMLTAAGEPKVTDFGLAKRLAGAGLTATGAVVGTPAYMAPEQAGGTKFVGPPADVWSLGVMLYELLAGERPFVGDNSWSVLGRVMKGAYPPLSKVAGGVPRDLVLVAEHCLKLDPRDRYAGASELAADLRAYLAGRPISVRPAGRLETAAKWARRNPAVAGLFAALFAMVCGAAYREGGRVALLENQRAEAEWQKEWYKDFAGFMYWNPNLAEVWRHDDGQTVLEVFDRLRDRCHVCDQPDYTPTPEEHLPRRSETGEEKIVSPAVSEQIGDARYVVVTRCEFEIKPQPKAGAPPDAKRRPGGGARAVPPRSGD